MSMESIPSLIRTACRLQAIYSARAALSVHDDDSAWRRFLQSEQALARAHKRWHKAQQHQLGLAAPGLRAAWLGKAHELREAAQVLSLQVQQRTGEVPELTLLVAELRQIQE